MWALIGVIQRDRWVGLMGRHYNVTFFHRFITVIAEREFPEVPILKEWKK